MFWGVLMDVLFDEVFVCLLFEYLWLWFMCLFVDICSNWFGLFDFVCFWFVECCYELIEVKGLGDWL